MLTKVLLAGFLLAHGLIHASFLAPRPAATAGGPAWPFDLGRSWALTPLGLDSATTSVLGMALIAATIAGFGLAAVAALGVAPGLWPVGVAVGGVASILLLGLFFHPWLALGVVIDLVLLWAVFLGSWAPDGLAS